jgi:hypothetical protein
MKHKTDAKEQAQLIIDEHKKNGLSDEDAKRCAITTVNLIISNIRYGTETHSLFMRTLNYLNS